MSMTSENSSPSNAPITLSSFQNFLRHHATTHRLVSTVIFIAGIGLMGLALVDHTNVKRLAAGSILTYLAAASFVAEHYVRSSPRIFRHRMTVNVLLCAAIVTLITLRFIA